MQVREPEQKSVEGGQQQLFQPSGSSSAESTNVQEQQSSKVDQQSYEVIEMQPQYLGSEQQQQQQPISNPGPIYSSDQPPQPTYTAEQKLDQHQQQTDYGQLQQEYVEQPDYNNQQQQAEYNAQQTEYNPQRKSKYVQQQQQQQQQVEQ